MNLQVKILLSFLILVIMIQCKKEEEGLKPTISFTINTPNENNYFVDLNPDSILITDFQKINFDTLVEDSIYTTVKSITLNFTKHFINSALFEPNLKFSILCEYTKHGKINRTKVEFLVITDYHFIVNGEPTTWVYSGTEIDTHRLEEGVVINEKMAWSGFGKLAFIDKIEIPEYNQSMVLENNNDFQKKDCCKNYIAFRYKWPDDSDYQYGWISLQIDNFNKLILYSYLFEKNAVTNML